MDNPFNKPPPAIFWDALAIVAAIAGITSGSAWLLIVIAAAIVMRWISDAAHEVAYADSGFPASGFGEDRDPVDPWALQRRLMAISGQALPDSPEINDTAVMYGALLMEESGETFKALSDALTEYACTPPCDTAASAAALLMAGAFKRRAQENQDMAGLIRQCLGETQPHIHMALTMTTGVAVELLDGVSDVCVVNCGLALSMGLPGPAGYSEIVLSNISKANPATGVIDKDPSGKWIKGAAFFKPNLVRVLDEHAAA